MGENGHFMQLLSFFHCVFKVAQMACIAAGGGVTGVPQPCEVCCVTGYDIRLSKDCHTTNQLIGDLFFKHC